MKYPEVIKAIATAKRFIEAAEKVKRYSYAGLQHTERCEHGKDAAAAKRASLDLTRQLAAMRKPYERR